MDYWQPFSLRIQCQILNEPTCIYFSDIRSDQAVILPSSFVIGRNDKLMSKWFLNLLKYLSVCLIFSDHIMFILVLLLDLFLIQAKAFLVGVDGFQANCLKVLLLYITEIRQSQVNKGFLFYLSNTLRCPLILMENFVPF